MEQPSPERCASLKAHKSLPRKRVVSDELGDDPELKTRSRKSYNSPAKEAAITSWIIDASPPSPTNLNFLLPLTPPEDDVTAASTTTATATDDTAMDEPHPIETLGTSDTGGRRRKKVEVRSHHSHTVSGSATPVNHKSPPTPDLTPPRRTAIRTPSPPLRRKNRISLSPPPTSRQASSKAESFKTAPEQSSPRLTSASVNTFHTTNGRETPTELARSSRDLQTPTIIGLGLGLTDADMKTPTVEVPTMTLDGSPLPEPGSFNSRELTPNMVKTDPLVASDIPAVRMLEQDVSYLEVYDDDAVGVSNSPNVQDGDESYNVRYDLEGTSRGASGRNDIMFDEDGNRRIESEISSRRSVSPLSTTDSGLDPLITRAKMDSKRFSQISSLSIPHSVEVVIIDSSPQRKHKLRHASKNPSLRAASSSHGGSNRSSLQSTSDMKPRLNSMFSKQAYVATGSSLHSDSGISIAGSDHIMKRWSKIQHIEIPRRAPSLARSVQQSTQRHVSPAYSRQAVRPSTAPNSSHALPAGPRQDESQTFSQASTLTKEYMNSRRGRQMVPPAIPKRSSSLSAPMSRETGNSNGAEPSSSSSSSSSSAQKQRKQPQQSHSKPSGVKTHGRSVSQPLPKPRIVVEPEVKLSSLFAPMHEIGRAPPPRQEPPVEGEIAMASKHKSESLEKPPSLAPIATGAKSVGSGSQSPRTPLWMRRASDASDIRPLHLVATTNPTPARGSKDDSALQASRALIKTPFSGVSVQSSASGFYEVHEATAINIYPHTNSSLLVIQQTPQDSAANFPAHPAVRPDAYRITEVMSPASSTGKVHHATDNSVHVTINGPDGEPVITRGEVPVRRVGSPLSNPRPAPSPQKAVHDTVDTLPAVNFTPPTPLGDPAGSRASANRATIVDGPVSLVKRALSSRRTPGGSVPRTSGLWLSSARRTGKNGNNNGSIKKRRNRPTVSENNLSPFWRPRRFWDSDEADSEEEDGATADAGLNGKSRGQFYRLGSNNGNRRQTTSGAANASDGDYFGPLPVRNTLGFPQQRVIINGPASLVRRLSSIRRRRNAVQAAWADPKLNPSLRGSSPGAPTTLPQPGAGSSTNLATAKMSNPRASPSPSAMERRRRSNTGSKRKVRFEFHPTRGLSGGSGESKEWRTKGMVRKLKETREKKRHEREARELERIERRRKELRGLIGRPRMSEEGGTI